MDKIQFKTVLMGYDKKTVNEAFLKLSEEMATLQAETKVKLRQAQKIASDANNAMDEMKEEIEKLKAEIETLSKQNSTEL